MGYFINIFNQKGGVGKTSTTYNLAHLSAIKEYKTLIIGFDLQKNITTNCIGIEKSTKINRSLYDIIIDVENNKKIDYKEYLIKVKNNLFIIPELASLDKLNDLVKQEEESRIVFKEFLEYIKSEFQFIYIDNPPRISSLFEQSLYYTDLVIMVLDLSFNSENGLVDILEFVQQKKAKLRLDDLKYKILFNRYNKSLLTNNETVNNLRNINSIKDYILKTILRQDVTIEKATRNFQSVFEYDKKSKASNDFNILLNEILGIVRMGK